MSYTQFGLTVTSLDEKGAKGEVENLGEMDAETVVEVYAQCADPDTARNPHLIGFKRVFVKAGEKAEVKVDFDKRAFTVVRADGKREKVSGNWEVTLGFHQGDARSVELTGEVPVKKTITL